MNHPNVRLPQGVCVTRREVLFEGLSEQEILNLPQEELDKLIFLGEPLVFRAVAVLLGSFKIASERGTEDRAVGGASVILAKRGRKAKTDRHDALHILNLLVKDDFPPIWVPSWVNRDMLQLLWHRHRSLMLTGGLESGDANNTFLSFRQFVLCS